MRTLIRNTQIISMDESKPEVFQGDIGIENDRIILLGQASEDFGPDYVIQGENTIALPGLVNAHTHISMSLMRNYADDLPFWPWLTEKILPLEENLRGEDCYWGAMLSIAEMIRSGITMFADMYFFMDDVARAVEKTGIRANLSRGLVSGDGSHKKLEEALELKENWAKKAQGRITVNLAPHAPYSCGPDFMKKILAKSEAYDTRIHTHLSESKKEVEDAYIEHGVSPIKNMLNQGVFNRPTFAAHCVHLSDEDIQILAENNVSVVNNPGSNLKLGNGFAPVSKLIEAGVNVALGTDGSASNNNLNMFEEMNLAALVNKAVTGDTTTIPAYTALKMATINGARALGMEDEIGSLEIGKKADLILIDMEKPHLYPRLDPVATLVYSAQASDVTTLICNGRILMEDRVLRTLKESEVYDEAEKCAKRLIRMTQEAENEKN